MRAGVRGGGSRCEDVYEGLCLVGPSEGEVCTVHLSCATVILSLMCL